ncbi:SDR family oxidoreductase [Psychrobacter sp. N25K4-3-2]|jgi:3-oxoacyl-[acyl-carrier protein] reductase|uniref:SDR family oxidoreductase n=1 Tax=Psychrobacter sp. N25K4-3-2 TaxID=2785026 RepID=UPI00188A7682|nr:SDR family oxidoreductase [Psychrobacter sp. N25K4-3-2]MBF4490661.1 SDR family oxidoreductase [Psychrobacter sp. N25K4-3-2]
MTTLKNKIAIVTGSSKGIGAQIALLLAESGAKTVINYANDDSAANDIVSQIKSAGGEAIAVQADVSSAKQVEAMFDTTIDAFGKPDILVNSAGVIICKPIAETTDEDFDRIFSINVKGTFNTLREAATKLNDGGRIVNLSSTTTRMMLPTYSTYCATKGAVDQLTRIFSKEVGTRGITVNAVSPGPTDTELFHEGKADDTVESLASMSPFNRIGEPVDIARVVAFLVSEEAAWVTGQNIGANGGIA